MRILLVATTSTTIDAFLLPLAVYLRESGFQVEIACSLESFPDAPSREKEIRNSGFKVHHVAFARSIHPWIDLLAFFRLYRLIGREKYSLVHTHTSKAGFLGRLAAWWAGCPVIVHTAYDFYHRKFRGGFRYRIFLFLEKLSARWCDAELFVSETVRSNALRHRIKVPENLILIGHGIDTTLFSSDRSDIQAIRSHYGIQPCQIWIGTLGRLVESKGMDIFLKAARQIVKHRNDIRFVVAGSGPLKGDLESLAEKLGLSAYVQFPGYLSTAEDTMKLLAGLDVFVLATRREGLGVVYLEAMAMGCPIIGTRIAPVTEIVQEGETGLLFPIDDPESLAGCMMQMLENADLRKKMGLAGKNYVHRNFNDFSSHHRTAALYRRLADDKGIHREDR